MCDNLTKPEHWAAKAASYVILFGLPLAVGVYRKLSFGETLSFDYDTITWLLGYSIGLLIVSYPLSFIPLWISRFVRASRE